MRYDEILLAREQEIAQQRADLKAGRDPRAFIPTGLKALDDRGGTKRGVLTLYGAATGEGKSIFKLHLATAAAKAGYSVCVLDWEDPVSRTADRTFSTETGINNASIASLKITDSDQDNISLAAQSADWAERIDVHDGLVNAKQAMQIVDRSSADLVLIDYLQGLPDGEGLERTIAGFCWDLNKWAQDNKAAVVAFSQVRGGVEERGLRMQEAAARRDPSKPPYVEGFRPFGSSDLAWCGAAGQRAKELGFLFRPGRYRRRFGEAIKDDMMEISFPKRNWGAEGNVRVGFDGKSARLYDLQKEKQ